MKKNNNLSAITIYKTNKVQIPRRFSPLPSHIVIKHLGKLKKSNQTLTSRTKRPQRTRKTASTVFGQIIKSAEKNPNEPRQSRSRKPRGGQLSPNPTNSTTEVPPPTTKGYTRYERPTSNMNNPNKRSLQNNIKRFKDPDTGAVTTDRETFNSTINYENKS
jgi:hypothetical protein